jgi:integrase
MSLTASCTAGRSLAMRKKVITNVKIILSHAKRLGYVAQNVALGIRIGSKAERDERAPLRAGVDFPTHTELRTLMETATGRWRPLLICGIFTGMRASELRGLTWANVDLATVSSACASAPMPGASSAGQSRRPVSGTFCAAYRG